MQTGIFYRVKRGEKWKSVDFGELTFAEREEFLERMDADALRRTIHIVMIATSAAPRFTEGEREAMETLIKTTVGRGMDTQTYDALLTVMAMLQEGKE